MLTLRWREGEGEEEEEEEEENEFSIDIRSSPLADAGEREDGDVSLFLSEGAGATM